MPPHPITQNSGGPRVEKLQREIKETLKHHGFPWRAEAVIVDGKPGAHTFDASRMAGWLQGLSREQLKKIGQHHITPHAEAILTHEQPRTPAMKRAASERGPHAAKLRHHHNNPPQGDGIVTFDGKPCAKEIAYWLQKSRDHKGPTQWTGILVSGVRTKQHSEDLCYAICGAPSCPGRCAGQSSNHCCPPSFKCKEGEGAADVTDYENFEQVQKEIGSPLRNDLPADPVHFSYSGH